MLKPPKVILLGTQIERETTTIVVSGVVRV